MNICILPLYDYIISSYNICIFTVKIIRIDCLCEHPKIDTTRGFLNSNSYVFNCKNCRNILLM